MCYDMSSIVVFFLLFISLVAVFSLFFFFNDTATTEIYTLSLHDALPIYVAKESGFSSTTVSIVLNNAPLARYIPVATKKRIERAAKKLGYRPNLFARSLRSKRSHTVGVMIFDMTDPFCPLVLRGIENCFYQA